MSTTKPATRTVEFFSYLLIKGTKQKDTQKNAICLFLPKTYLK
jgi:hypothetical protein